jgi:hypothetical protein
VYFGHNHYVGAEALSYGAVPCNDRGEPYQIQYTTFHRPEFKCSRDVVLLKRISDRWRSTNQVTEYEVLLKTLQQARIQQIWQPCYRYSYHWDGGPHVQELCNPRILGWTLDVGLFTSIHDTLNRQTYQSAENSSYLLVYIRLVVAFAPRTRKRF